MATRIEPITLPWKRPERGVSAAELGASFRVEQREEGWHCTVTTGRRATVLATKMKRLRDAQCRAEAHAATMPEVAAALANAAVAPARAPRGAAPAAAQDSPRGPAAPAFEVVSDGCICGKIETGTWIADPAGKVSVPAGTDPALAQEICRVATAHYTAKAPASQSRAQTKTASKAKTKTTAKVTAKAKIRAAAKAEKAAAKTASKAAAAKAESKAAAKTVTKAESKAASKAAAKAESKAPSKAAAKAESKAASKAAAKAEAKVASKAPAPKAAKRGGRAKRKASKKVGKTAGKAAAPRAAKEEPMGKQAGKAKSEACGCIVWTDVDGKARGEAKHGAFVIETEGKKHALYFYDPEGHSRHIQSGDAAKLRSVAETMAARGQPAPRATAASDDAAMLKMFMAGAMEDEA